MFKKLTLAMCILLVPCLLTGCNDLNHCYPSKYKDSSTYVRRGYTATVELASRVQLAFTAKKKQTTNVEFEVSYGHDKILDKDCINHVEQENITFAICRRVQSLGSDNDYYCVEYLPVNDDFLSDDYARTIAGSRNKCSGFAVSWYSFSASFIDTFDVSESGLVEGEIRYYFCLMKDGEEYDDTWFDDDSINNYYLYQYFIAGDGHSFSVNFEINDGEVTLS